MNAVDLLRRAAGKPPGYLVRRALEEATKRARSGWLLRRIRHLTPESLAAKSGHPSLGFFWRSLGAGGFLYSGQEREQLREIYHGPLAAARGRIRERVEKIVEHEFDLLGSGPKRLGAEIDWHLDFKSGRRWGIERSAGIDYAELDLPSDIKVPWELSRGYHLITLGQAWLVDRDPRAISEFQAQIRSWIQSNPIGFGIHWTCTMEVALRATNWIWALALFADAPFDDDFLGEILTELYRHGMWISDHLEIAHINGNHYIADALGMVACGVLFQNFDEGREWLRRGSAILEQEIRLQVTDDGVDIEASIPYHRLSLEIFLTGARLLQSAGQTPSDVYWNKIELMIEFIYAYTLQDGSSPVIGDADDGRVLVFDDTPVRDHRYLLEAGWALFAKNHWTDKARHPSEYSLWLLGPSVFERKYQAIPPKQNSGWVQFDDAGFYIFRSPQQYLFIDAGPVGFKGLGGHGHNDCLSFEWHAAGRPVLTDSGLYVYTASPEWRNRFRSTEFHNTIRVDREEINHFLSPPTLWFLGNDAQPIDVECGRGGNTFRFDAGHTGYRRLPDPVTVFRTFELDRELPRLRLNDRLEGRSEHLVEFFFHAAPGSKLRFISKEAIEFSWPDGFGLVIQQESGPEAAFEEREGWFAPSYGVKLPRPVCVASVRTRLPFELTWVLTVRNQKGERPSASSSSVER
jgi:hypothetical protein